MTIVDITTLCDEMGVWHKHTHKFNGCFSFLSLPAYHNKPNRTKPNVISHLIYSLKHKTEWERERERFFEIIIKMIISFFISPFHHVLCWFCYSFVRQTQFCILCVHCTHAHQLYVHLVKDETKVLNVDDLFFFSPLFASFYGLSIVQLHRECVSISMSLHRNIFQSNFERTKDPNETNELQLENEPFRIIPLAVDQWIWPKIRIFELKNRQKSKLIWESCS